MSHQEILFNPQLALSFHQQRIQEIKNSLAFNGQMAEHYEALYNKHRRNSKLNLVRAAWYFFKWKHYERECWNIKVNTMLKERGLKPMMP